MVSLNDTEELSSAASEEEEEEEEEEDDEEEGSDESDEEKEEEEEEDSGSEVEIIEEVQGNRTLLSLQPGPPAPLFEQTGLPHFLGGPPEVLSLIPAEAELKVTSVLTLLSAGALQAHSKLYMYFWYMYVLALNGSTNYCVASYPSFLCCIRGTG